MIERNKKKLDEVIVSISLLFLFWMIITLPPKPLSAIGLKNIVEHILIGLIFSGIITMIIPYPLITTSEIKKYFHFKIFLKYIAPVMIFIVFLHSVGLLESAIEQLKNYWIIIVLGIVILAIMISRNRKKK